MKSFRYSYYLFFLIFIVGLSGCSLIKNPRSGKFMRVKYNSHWDLGKQNDQNNKAVAKKEENIENQRSTHHKSSI
ncbi:MAG: hypothetical protein ABEH43_11290, partial [Flavobacteriales bacterium]